MCDDIYTGIILKFVSFHNRKERNWLVEVSFPFDCENLQISRLSLILIISVRDNLKSIDDVNPLITECKFLGLSD